MLSSLSPIFALHVALAHLPALVLAQNSEATACATGDGFCVATAIGFSPSVASVIGHLSAPTIDPSVLATDIPEEAVASSINGPLIASIILSQLNDVPEVSSVLAGVLTVQSSLPSVSSVPTGTLSASVLTSSQGQNSTMTEGPTQTETQVQRGTAFSSGWLPDNSGVGNGTRVISTPTPTPSHAAAGRVAESSSYVMVLMAGLTAGIAGLSFAL